MVKLLLISALIICNSSLFAGTYSGGSGTSGSPYQIETLADLIELSTTSADWASGIYFIQTADIDAALTSTMNEGAGFSPFGNEATRFRGNYDGQNHTISNLYIYRNITDYVGLFGYSSGSTISNLGLSNINISGDEYIGGLVGCNQNSTISNCYSSGSVSGNYHVGGFCGWNFANISNCYSSGSVSGAGYAGGFCGWNYAYSTISNCYSSGSVSGNFDVGGFCGWNYFEATISNCYSTGSVSCTDEVGGFCGRNSSSSTISNCYSTGSVSGSRYVGGFCGENEESNISNCYFDSQTSGQSSSSGGTAKTTAEMKTQATFSGWDFETTPIWNILRNEYITYPYIQGFTYDTPAASNAITPLPGLQKFIPTVQASNIQFSNITRTSMTVRWTRGNGDACLLLGREQFKIPASPLTEGVNYTCTSSSYTNSANATVAGGKVLYKGTDANPIVNVSGLTKYKLYYFRVIEYNNSPFPYYNQTTSINNPRSRWTLRRDGMAEEDLSIDSEYPYPNPVSYTINTKLDVFDAGNITAYLFDNSGRQIAELYNQYHEFGTYDLQFDLSQIAQGTYQLVINKGSEAVVYPISVIR